MRDYGSFFRSERLTRGLRQKDLAKGICTIDTISRIEKGSQTPQAFLFGALLERLGVSGFSYGDLFEAGGIRNLSLKHDILHAMEMKQFEDLAVIIGEFSDVMDEKDPWDRQFYLYARARFLYWSDSDTWVFLKCLRNALKVTREHSPEEDYPIEGFLTELEKMILNRIAVTEFESGKEIVGLSLINRLILSQKNSEDCFRSHWKDLCVFCHNAALMELKDFPDIAREHLFTAKKAWIKSGDLIQGAKLLRSALLLDCFEYRNRDLEYELLKYYYSKLNADYDLVESFDDFMIEPEFMDITI